MEDAERKEYYKGEIIKMLGTINNDEVLNYIYIVVTDLLEERG